MSFVVVRHLETGGVGVIPEAAAENQRYRGWVRVSDPRPEPADFHLPDFADAPDLDAEPEPESPAEPEETEES